ncbi:GDSL-type esterase/lipase family protein [Dysgonomonas sp. 520]|uniref:GDSL-type esterase/lipase family protein n=1 Tax=Dysgonomonas sp. 520 TaxID=2302931 RepID=UPI0013D7B4E0|nr:GDSL-type esterase/lipase family protein [Dysgonomonas sp. 520]NDW09959.1 hypothetical protein [Dysgonomonas sp. 520]
MRKTTLIITILLFALFSQSFDHGSPKKVACVGDSITDGDGLQDRSKEAYPAILSVLLGDGYQVVNFGKSGATMLKSGDWPYWDKPAFREALAFNPDIVIIQLGANDTKPQNIPSFPGKYEEDLRAMVDSFQQLSSHPEIFLCKPIPSFKNRFHINDTILCSEAIPAIDKVAFEKKCRVIDLHAAFLYRPEFFPDGVHPDKNGAIEMAVIVAKSIK